MTDNISNSDFRRTMKAKFLPRSRDILSNVGILQLVNWRLLHAVFGSTQSFKYRLYDGRAGMRIAGFDNERRNSQSSPSDHPRSYFPLLAQNGGN
jgi:hypothetical protein